MHVLLCPALPRQSVRRGAVAVAGSAPRRLVPTISVGYPVYLLGLLVALALVAARTSAQCGSPPVQSGLVLALPFDEGGGDTVFDKSGLGFNGTLVTPSWINFVPGKYGTAAEFLVDSSLIEVAASASLTSSGGVTCSAWVYAYSHGNWRTIVYKGPEQFYLMTDPGGKLAFGGSFGGGAATSLIDPGAPLPLNTWVHVAGTFDTSRIRIYVNGVLRSSQVKNGNIATSATYPLMIGGDWYYAGAYGEWWKGRIDEVRVYDRQLGDAEIVADMTDAIEFGFNPCQNSASCVAGMATFTCVCAAGWTGTLCDMEINECSSAPCQNGGICTDLVADYSCSCVSGWNGRDCDLNEDDCSSHPCSDTLSGSCTFGGLVAAYGFEEASGNTIVDVSAAGLHDGTLTASGAIRAAGYVGRALDFDGTNGKVDIPHHTDFDLAEYTHMAWVYPRTLAAYNNVIRKGQNDWWTGLWNNGMAIPPATVQTGSTSTSWYSQGQVELNQWSHITGSFDGVFMRQYVNGILAGAFFVDGATVGTSSSPVYIGGDDFYPSYFFDGLIDEVRIYNRALSQEDIMTDMQIAVDRAAFGPCMNGGTCSDAFQSHTCNCLGGWFGASCESDTDWCAGAPCQNGGTCAIQNATSYSCSCAFDFVGNDCQTAIDDCSSDPCQNGGTCTDMIGSYACACALGYTGTECQTNVDDCSTTPCLNGGTCTDGVNGYTCACGSGYTGSDCQIDIDDCSTNPCQNGATCVDLVSAYSCQCTNGYTGADCQTDIDECAATPCLNGATCMNLPGSYSCTCAAGYTGATCGVGVNECSVAPCQNGGVCNDLVGTYSCSCVAGYTGTNCEIDINECSSAPCAFGGTCVDGVAAFTCNCVAGYTGILCQFNVNECLAAPCQNGGTCLDGINSHSCLCVSGYEGVDCATETNECSTNPCLNGATCTDGLATYSCACTALFTGPTCLVPTSSICNSFPCDNSGVCNDMGATYSCTCPPGFIGSNCETNVDDCSVNVCQNGGTCNDGVQSYVCSCAPGWTGTACLTDINECSSNPCQNGATCIDEMAAYTCACATGFVGSNCQTVAAVDPTPGGSGDGVDMIVVVGAGSGLLVLGAMVFFIGWRRSKKKTKDRGIMLDEGATTFDSEISTNGTYEEDDDSDDEISRSGVPVSQEFLSSFATRNTTAELDEYFSALQKAPSRRQWKQALALYMSPMSLFGTNKFAMFCQGLNVQRWILPLLLRKDLGSHTNAESMLQNITSISMSGEQSLIQLALLLINEVHYRQLTDSLVEGEDAADTTKPRNSVSEGKSTGNSVVIDIQEKVGISGVIATLQYFRESKEWSRSETSVAVVRLLIFTLLTKLKSSWKVPLDPYDSSPTGGGFAWLNFIQFMKIVEEFIVRVSAQTSKSGGGSSPLNMAVGPDGFEDKHLVTELLHLIERVRKRVDLNVVEPVPPVVHRLMTYLKAEAEFWTAMQNYMTEEMTKLLQHKKRDSGEGGNGSGTPTPAASNSAGSARSQLLVLLASRDLIPGLEVEIVDGVVRRKVTAGGAKTIKNAYSGSAASGMLKRAEAALRKRHGEERLKHVAKFATRIFARQGGIGSSDSKGGMPTINVRSSNSKSLSRRSLSRRSQSQASAAASASAYLLGDDEVDQLRKYVKAENCIGKGAFGSVYRARYRGDHVALKVVHVKDKRSLERFFEEVQSQALIRSPRLLSVMGFAAQPPDLYLVTEIMERGSLVDVLSASENEMLDGPKGEKTLTPYMRVELAVDAAKSLLFLHTGATPLLHGDIKLANILMNKRWNLKVADFGLSRGMRAHAMGDSGGVSHIKGSMLMLPPEAFEGANGKKLSIENQLKQDVYAFGLVLMELFVGVGTAPWSECDAVSLISRHANKEPRELTKDQAALMPPPLLALAYKCLVDVEKRPTMQDVLESLESILDRMKE